MERDFNEVDEDPMPNDWDLGEDIIMEKENTKLIIHVVLWLLAYMAMAIGIIIMGMAIGIII